MKTRVRRGGIPIETHFRAESKAGLEERPRLDLVLGDLAGSRGGREALQAAQLAAGAGVEGDHRQLLAPA